MNVSVEARPDLQMGCGAYSFPQAATIVGRGGSVNSQSIRRWMRSGLAPAERDIPGEQVILTFHDLVSLEVVRRFRAAHVSLQKVRKVEQALRERQPSLHRPFANRLFFTDGASIWVELNGVTEEVVGSRPNHIVFRSAIASFAQEIRYEHDVAVAWDISDMVEIDPSVQFGQPVVRGTRITVDTIVENLKAGPAEAVADWYGLSVRQVEGVASFAGVA